MNNLSKVQLAAALVAALGISAPAFAGDTPEKAEKGAKTQVEEKAEKKEKKSEKKEKAEKSCKKGEKSCKKGEKSCKSAEGEKKEEKK
jgi:hypothetical protein